MSIELFLYSDTVRPDPAEFDAAMRHAGWITRFVAGLQDLRPVSIEKSTLVLGLPIESATTLNTDAWAESDLQHLYRQEKIAAASVYVVLVGDSERETLREIADHEAPREYQERIRGSSVVFSVATYATRNERSLQFKRAVWGALGIATAGVLHDPDAGEFTDIPA